MTVRKLKVKELDKGIDIFASAITRYWANTKEEVRGWVYEEFHHPESIALGAFENGTLVGVCSFVPFHFILEHTDKEEAELIRNALQMADVSLGSVVFGGGLGVKKGHEGKGVAKLLLKALEDLAAQRGYTALVGQTAKPSGKYPHIPGLPRLLKVFNWFILPLSKKLYYNPPGDLEKVWVAKIIDGK